MNMFDSKILSQTNTEFLIHILNETGKVQKVERLFRAS